MSGVWQHTGPLLLIMVALAVVSMFTGCREETLDARLALVHHEPGMEEIVLMLDRSIYLVPIEEGAAEPRLLYEAAEVDPSLDAFIPLIRYDGHEMTLYTFRLSRMAGDHIQAPVTVNRFSCQLPEGDLERVTSSIREGESLELMEEALTSGTPMTPIAFTGQQLTFEHDGSWYRLTVEAEGPRHNRYSYAFHMTASRFGR